MPLVSTIAIYFVVWWLCLFMVLPFGIKSQTETEQGAIKGTEPGAPWRANIGKKLLATTLLSAVVMALLLWGLSNPVLQEYWR